MIQVIPSGKRHHQNFGWLDTRWHFSFSDYHDPDNMQWGALRVFNDDVIAPGQGFGTHPHKDMEIVTWVLEGALEHKDSLGNTGVIRSGEVQVMSAGKGIRHSEYNHSKTEPLHLLQLWVFPRKKGLTPRWEQRDFSAELVPGKLFPVVSDGSVPETLRIDQDAAIYLSELGAGKQVTHASAPGRKGYLFVVSGEVSVNGKELGAGDQARIADESRLDIRGRSDSSFMLLDLPS
jgi:redox-sensitive bicupin YhaK (pirin superfamily)